MKVIGLTGGIGGGKSAVTRILAERYAAYGIDTDTLGHEVTEPGTEICRKILEEFGQGIAAEGGGIDRKKLAEIVFSDAAARERLNGLIHPAVTAELERRIEERRKEGKTPYVVFETALLIEAGLKRCCDEVWYVRVPEEIRRERLIRERGYSAEKTAAIFASQKSDEEFMEAADAVIENTGSLEDTAGQVKKLLTGDPD